MYRNPEFHIEIKSGMNIKQTHALLTRALEFPRAFYDCIRDDSQSNLSEVLIIKGWDVFMTEHHEAIREF